MCALLAKSRRGVFDKTDQTIRTLVLYSINTGALTTPASHTFIYAAIYFLLPKLYLNSALAHLNARKTLREQLSGGVVTIPLPNTSGSTDTYAGRSSEGGRPHEHDRLTSAALCRGHMPVPTAADYLAMGSVRLYLTSTLQSELTRVSLLRRLGAPTLSHVSGRLSCPACAAGCAW
ncbi:hypothetical protein GY45DRAFT_284944 [Cubamyces sp. BRFM 1775]|nr:hypothetical protein GY45DRAFT_284944 [Cubamyces sp. BRFM 1775]